MSSKMVICIVAGCLILYFAAGLTRWKVRKRKGGKEDSLFNYLLNDFSPGTFKDFIVVFLTVILTVALTSNAEKIC